MTVSPQPGSSITSGTARQPSCLAGLAAVAGLLASASGLPGAGATAGIPAGVPPAGLAGQLLVATTALQDPRFIRTVVYLVHHDSEGAMGLILNRPIGELSLSELLERFGMEGESVSGAIRVHVGGPVEPARGFVLHTADYSIEGTELVKDGIAMTARPEILRAIATRTGPRKRLFALGYAGWASGQLEAEIREGSWEVVPADQAIVFDEHYETKWERAMARRTIHL
jgi:putative transcriptional regulator